MSLQEFDKKCREILHSEACPPILGLAPFTRNDIDRIGHGVGNWLQQVSVEERFKALLFLLDRLPAAISVWLARKAGEAYEWGTFWDHFEEKIAIHIPLMQRPE